MKPISSIAVQAIEEALARLAVHPGSGKLTATRLAAEAGVSRATLYRAPELLWRFREPNAVDREEPLTATDRIRELEALVAVLRGCESDELRELRGGESPYGSAHPGTQPARARPTAQTGGQNLMLGTLINYRSGWKAAVRFVHPNEQGAPRPDLRANRGKHEIRPGAAIHNTSSYSRFERGNETFADVTTLPQCSIVRLARGEGSLH
ncbi:hypothetical protein [Mesorhizobium sp. J428]|uniref:hypothetical protein n=1 Tax=Mesorhizobium sp. J428 TaxID=2898440 RepID=UPI0021518279|nr:hypothetical protein [Mesorhizobium sp. J428]MCR5857375.1 hypothetical protein [Mesorhizobium sp. J428]